MVVCSLCGSPCTGCLQAFQAGANGRRRGPDGDYLQAWGYPSQPATEQDLIEAFHELNPDVHVTFIMAPLRSYYDKLGIMFASGTAPDVVRVNNVQFPVYVGTYVITSGSGGPKNATLFYALYLYRSAFRFFKMGR